MIINSLLENDLYSFTQMQAILHHFPNVDVEYQFKCRNKAKDLGHLVPQIRAELNDLCSLRFEEDELGYLSSLPFIKHNYVEFLRNFKLQRDMIVAYELDGELVISIHGNWFHTVLFEVPVLAIVSELAHRGTGDLDFARTRLKEKMDMVRQSPCAGSFKFADFGLRRRFSSDWQDEIVRTLVKELPNNFIGSSNVYLAQKYNVRPIGTMSHQWIMAGQALSNVSLVNSQAHMLETWVKEYRGDLGIALSDTLGFDAFLRDFDLYFAKLFDGCRHDSGDPYVWCDRLIDHYRKLKIDPKTKSAVFSDGLTFPLALDLCTKYNSQINTSFGIGTNLTNERGVVPFQNVIKVTRVNGKPVAKISDSPGKGMCEDEGYLAYLKSVFRIEG